MAWKPGKSSIFAGEGRWMSKCSWCLYKFHAGDVTVRLGTGTAFVHRSCLKRALIESYEQVDVQASELLDDQFAGDKTLTPKQMFDAYRNQLLEQFHEEEVSA